MKTDVRLLAVIALLVSACTTGSMVTSRGYSDDAYYTPGDHPPVITNAVPSNPQPERHSSAISGFQQDDAAKIVDNYLSDKKSGNSNSDVINNGQVNPDSTYFSDEEAKNLINNYNEPEDVDYTTRIRTFYDPYAYDPYWDSFYSPGFGFGWGLGFGGLYGGYGFGGLYGGFYNPFFGWGMYNPFWGGYYGGNYGYGGGFNGRGHGFYNGRQNYAGRMGSTGLGLSGTGNRLSSSASGINSAGRTVSGTSLNGATKSASINSTRQAGTRYTAGQNLTKGASLNAARQSRSTLNATNLRRTTVRNAVTSSAKGYTPTYSRPRTNTQSSYNSGNTRQYSRPQSSGTATRSSVSNSYQRGSSRSGVTSSTLKSAPVRSSSSSSSSKTYSAPSRSSSGGGGGGGGGRSFSGGGGGGGGRRR